MAELTTPRLRLRHWREADREPLAAINRDPVVMEHFPSPWTLETTDWFLDRVQEMFSAHGFGLWAAELIETAELAGFIGLSVPSFETHFTPCVEVGWRLRADLWGRGLATEGARAALDFGFSRAGLDEIVSFTVPANIRSRRVMEKIGMMRDPAGDFDHPRIPRGHPLCGHVLYRIQRPPGYSALPVV